MSSAAGCKSCAVHNAGQLTKLGVDVDRWDYVLKGEDSAPTSWSWEGWTQLGGIKLPKDHRAAEGNARIHFPVLEVPQAFPGSWQTSGERLAE